MLKIVRLALTRPYTFIVLAMLIVLIGPLAALRTPTDIFPDIRIPVISVIWNYAGLQPDDMSGRIVTYYERTLGTTVNDVQHIESQSFRGYGIVKIFFQPTVDIRTATAQVTSVSQTVLKQMPPGITPPRSLTTTHRRFRSCRSRSPATRSMSRSLPITLPTSFDPRC